MSRHFIDYAAMSCEPLGTPIRREQPKQSPETQWAPVAGHPDYRERINAQGIRGVSHKDHVPAPVAPAPAVAGLTQAEAAARGDVATAVAPTEWQSGPPPVGWWQVRRDDIDVGFCAAYWNGARYTRFTSRGSAREYFTDLVSMYPDPESGVTWLKPAGELRALWRGPRLVGADWPEPQQ